MFAGKDFPSMFEGDNFTQRRTTGHNWYDPECLISGREVSQGYTYLNSGRWWTDQNHYIRAVSQELTPEEILNTAPRRFYAS